MLGGQGRKVRLGLFATIFVLLVGLEGYGLWTHQSLFVNAWSPSGRSGLLAFAAGYGIAVLATVLCAPGRLPAMLLAVAVAATCGAVGVGAPAAVALFFFASFVLGSALLRRAAADPVPLTDVIFATLLGAIVFMTVVGWTAMLPVHYPIIHMAFLALPFVVWPRLTRQCLRSVGALLKPVAWTSRWEALTFALAALIPLVHLFAAVLLPQLTNDATVLHLAVPSVVAINHFWAFDVTRFVFAVFPLGTSWMILPAYLLGGEFAARLVNFCFFLATMALLADVLRRYLEPGAAWLLTAVFASTPIFLAESANIFAENLWTALLFASAIAVARFKEGGAERDFILGAVFAAASLAVKVMGAALIVVLFAAVLRECLKRPARIGWGCAIFALLAAYPYAWAYHKTGNPLFPLMNDIFKSPYFLDDQPFRGLNRAVPTGLYALTFDTVRWADGGSQNGSFGFQYLVLLPLSVFAFGRRYPYFGVISIVCALVFLASTFRFAEPNLRYMIPAMPFIMVAIAIACARARELSRSLYAGVCCYAFVATAINIGAMPVAAWASRDFSLAMSLGRRGIDEYRDRGAPERRLVEYLNLTRGHAVRVAIFGRPILMDLKGDAVFGNWYNYPITTVELAKVKTIDDVYRLMRKEHVTAYMGFTPESGNLNYTTFIEAFLAKYVEPEFVVGDAYVGRYRPEWRFTEELLANGDFAQGLADWSAADPSVYAAGSGSVAVSATNPIIQTVPVDDRVTYRLALTFRCRDPSASARLWVNWLDGSRRPISAALSVRPCEDGFKTVATELAPPAGAQFAQVLVAGHAPDRSVEVRRVSLTW